MRIVVALGGNALLHRGEPAEAQAQRHNVEIAARAIAGLADEHEVVVTHGNGPQVGLLALQSESYADVAPYPLDVLGAESEGMIGYLLEIALRNRMPERRLATLLTEVVVAADDPAFENPTKPIGPVYSREEASRHAAERDWAVRPDGEAFRRVVPSPDPLGIVALEVIRTLVDTGALVICAGGGGLPVVRDEEGRLRGVEAVIDKDLTAALLAAQLRADMLLMLTDVAAVEVGWGTPAARPLRETTPAELARHEFAAGSMGPKIEAARRFVSGGVRRAAIGALGEAPEIVAGRSGTRIAPDPPGPQPHESARAGLVVRR